AVVCSPPAATCPLFALPRAHLALHSFPTRRPSDLWRCSAACCAPAPSARWTVRTRWPRSSPPCSPPPTTTSPAPTTAPTCSRPRSEEHTSELQSRENLVCRLLLEKKEH